MIPDFTIKAAIDTLHPIYDALLVEQLSEGIKLSKNIREARRGENVKTEDPTKCERFSYDCKHSENVPGVLVLTEDEQIGAPDDIAKMMHKNHGLVREFWKHCLGLNSFSNDKIVDLHGNCHFSEKYANAYYSEEKMVYGDGDGKIFLELTRDIDVGGHELGHGIVDHSKCQLKYWGDPGAINEHIADVMGECCAMWCDGLNKHQSDWLLGAAVIAPYARSKGWRAIRSFKNEKAYPDDPQPKHNSKKYRGLQDNGGVHINSGILNHWFYLFVQNWGGSFAFETPLTVVYNALNKLPHSFASFSDYVKATQKACVTKPLREACDAAWREVGLIK